MMFQSGLLAWGYGLAVLLPIAGLGLAITKSLSWWRRRQRTHRAAREAQAKRVYASYLLQAMEHPELARPGPVDATRGRQRAQYQWFVGYLLTVSEEILLIDPSPAWRETLARQLAPHRAFLTSPAFIDGPYRGLTDEIRFVIAEALEQSTRAAEAPGRPAPRSNRA